jgi:hypothetical protein
MERCFKNIYVFLEFKFCNTIVTSIFSILYAPICAPFLFNSILLHFSWTIITKCGCNSQVNLQKNHSNYLVYKDTFCCSELKFNWISIQIQCNGIQCCLLKLKLIFKKSINFSNNWLSLVMQNNTKPKLINKMKEVWWDIWIHVIYIYPK